MRKKEQLAIPEWRSKLRHYKEPRFGAPPA